MRRQPPSQPWRAIWIDADGYDRWLEARVADSIRKGDMWAARGGYQHLKEARRKRGRKERG